MYAHTHFSIRLTTHFLILSTSVYFMEPEMLDKKIKIQKVKHTQDLDTG